MTHTTTELHGTSPTQGFRMTSLRFRSALFALIRSLHADVFRALAIDSAIIIVHMSVRPMIASVMIANGR